MTLRTVGRATSTLCRVGALAPILATLWVFGFVSLASPMPPREWVPSTSILINRWPQPCEELVIPGRKLPVKIDLGLSITAGPDFLHVDFGADRTEFDRRLRERTAWLSPTSRLLAERPESFRKAAAAEYAAVLGPSRMAELFRCRETGEAGGSGAFRAMACRPDCAAHFGAVSGLRAPRGTTAPWRTRVGGVGSWGFARRRSVHGDRRMVQSPCVRNCSR